MCTISYISGVKTIKLYCVRDLDDWGTEAWERLGYIIGNNTIIQELKLLGRRDLDVGEVFLGLQLNQHIQKLVFYGIDLRDTVKMNSLAPFLCNNPVLKKIDLSNCNLNSDGVNILAEALSNRLRDTLENINLSENDFRTAHLDSLTTVLAKCRRLKLLSLNSNGIGEMGCLSIANLLKSTESSNIGHVDLSGNAIDSQCAILLAESLTNNTKMKTLQLWGNKLITAKGWEAMLKLVCDSSSIEAVKTSNHILHNIPTTHRLLVSLLGIDDANLFRASLRMNNRSNKNMAIRQKLIWTHSRGDLNVGSSTVPACIMPDIISWFSDDFHDNKANLILHHDPPLKKTKEVDSIRLSSVFSITKTRPDVCQYYNISDISDQAATILGDATDLEKELWHCLISHELLYMADKQQNINGVK